jgi:hypothetical protein
VVDKLTKGVNASLLARSPALRERLGDALLLAAENGYRDVVRVLLARGVRHAIDMAIVCAEANGHQSVADLLKEPFRAGVEQLVDKVVRSSLTCFRGS